MQRPNEQQHPIPYFWKGWINYLEGKVHRQEAEIRKLSGQIAQPSLFDAGGEQQPGLFDNTVAEEPVSGNALFQGDDPTENRLGGFTAESEESRLAALGNYPKSGNQRHTILLAVFRKGSFGMTYDEARQELDIYSADRRMSELVDGGWLERTERTRTTQHKAEANVCVTTQKATEWIMRREPQVYREMTAR